MTTTESTPRRRPRTGSSRHSAHVLLNITPVVGIHRNRTSASSHTRNKLPIEVSFLFKRPPQQSTLFVSCSDRLNSDDPPKILCSEDDLILLRINVGRFGFHSDSKDDCDYFLYRANPNRPSLERLHPPYPFFETYSLGILPRSDGHYTLAVLLPTVERHVYKLDLFHSDTPSGWSTCILSAAAALQNPFPVDIPKNCHRLLSHYTTNVITIGGERGTIGWVDLWHGILLCDVLDPNPALRRVPLPLPLKDMRSNYGLGNMLGYPGHRRGISFIRANGCLKFVHMDMTADRLPGKDEETGKSAFRVDDWSLTTWSNKEMSNSLDDWHVESTVEASKITIDDDPAISRVLENSGLLLPKPQDDSEDEAAAARQQGLQNLLMCQPTPCVTGEDVVYLVARKKFMHPMSWMLAVETKDGGRVRAVGYSGHLMKFRYGSPMYFPSRISKFLNPKKLKNPATIRGN